MKRGPQHLGAEPRSRAPWERAPAQTAVCIKVLVSAREASCILGAGGGTCREIGQRTGSRLHLSGRGDFYPGTELQELAVRGPSAEAVAAGLAEAVGRVVEDLGRLACGEPEAEEGSACLRAVVPVAAARAVIGRGGENIRALRASSGLRIHVEEMAIGAGDAAEQVVSLQGGVDGLGVAIAALVERVAGFAAEPGFAVWAATSHAGHRAAPATQVAPGKARGKGGQRPVPGGDHWSNGWTEPYEAAAPFHHHRAPRAAPEPEWDHTAEYGGVELVAGAIESLPPRMLDPADRSQQVTFACPAGCVSAVIGKGGAGVKEVAAATQTKIQIREIEGNPSERAVIVTGSAVGVAAAYLHVAGRIAAVEELAFVGEAAPPGMMALPP